jgi:GT2 family glycosyltransferase
VTIAVLIVNWNSGNLLERCLESLARQRRHPDHIFIVDNASTDDSLTRAAAWLDPVGVVGDVHRVTLIRLSENAGFARANNIAARAAGGFDGLALLNPDAFADAGWLEALVRAAEEEPSVGAFASQMRLDSAPDFLDGAGDSYHPSGRAWRNGHGLAAAGWSVDRAEVFAPCAAAALYRRVAFEAAGGFDERYFCYFEDVDLGFRLRLQGFRTLYVPDACVRHVSSALGGYRSDFAVYHGERNMVWTFVKDMPGSLFWWYLPQHLLLNAASLLFYPWRGQGLVALRAKLDALLGLRGVLEERRRVQRGRTAAASSIRQSFIRGLARPYLRLLTGSSRGGIRTRASKGASFRADSTR